MTRPTVETTRPASELSADAVADYLRAHPDFFERHPAVLEGLSLPHGSGSAVSLVERQVSILRDRNIDMRARLGTLVTNARVNDGLFEHTRALILDALDAHTLAALLKVIRSHLLEQFELESMSLVLFIPADAQAAEVADIRFDALEAAQAAIGNLLRNQQTVLGMLRPTETAYLFPSRTPAPASAAVAPLVHNAKLYGVLAIGSADSQRFTGDMGTLFVRHVAEVLARLLSRLPDGS